MKEWMEQLRKEFPGLKVRSDVPYAELTTLGVGSRLPYLAEIADEKELAAVLKFTASAGIPVFILGGGTNLAGMGRAVPETRAPALESRVFGGGKGGRETPGRCVHPAAGAGPQSGGGRFRRARAAGPGIPGTLGGALRMNAGASGADIGGFTAEVTRLPA